MIEQLAAHAYLDLLQLCRCELGQQAAGVRGPLALRSHTEPALQMGRRDPTLFYLRVTLQRRDERKPAATRAASRSATSQLTSGSVGVSYIIASVARRRAARSLSKFCQIDQGRESLGMTGDHFRQRQPSTRA